MKKRLHILVLASWCDSMCQDEDADPAVCSVKAGTIWPHGTHAVQVACVIS